MIRNLTPDFILQQQVKDRTTGSFDAVCLFVDISGFTPLTTRLMEHGAEGAEVLAGVLTALFEPVIEIVYAYGGFVAGFAGDAFKAIFAGMQPASCHRAISAAWRIQNHFIDSPTQTTRFGQFEFSGKVCIGDGTVDWHIVQAGDPSPAGDSAQTATYIFDGSALATCLAADPYANTGEIVVTQTFYDRTATEKLHYVPVGSYWRLMGLAEQAPAGQLEREPAPGPIGVSHLASFYPETLLTSPIQGEFRRVTSLFANVQPLAPDQEPAFYAALFHLLDQYGGYLCRIGRIGSKDSGTTLLLFFGAPVAHENDVLHALSFILDLQQIALTPVRAGITTSLAYAGFVGCSRREEYTCHGTYVNLAARLMVAAGWHEIWLDAETARHGENAFELIERGEIQFKGFSAPQPSFQLTGRRTVIADHFFRGEMVGRQHELALLRRAAQPLQEGRFGGVVIVEGEPGIGKSRIVHTFEQEMQAVQWCHCQTDEIIRQPFNPIRYFLHSYFGQDASQDEIANKQRFVRKMDKLIAATEDPLLAAELDRNRSFLGALVDLYWEGSLYAQLEPQLRLANILEAVKTLVKAESLRRPLVIHLEDAHWLDDSSHALLVHLCRNVAAFPFLLLITRRPPTDAELGMVWAEPLPAEVPQTTIRLDGLADEDLAALVVARLEGPAAQSLLHLVADRSGGTPLFAEQTLLFLQEEGLLEQSHDGWQLRSDAADGVALPRDVRSLLTARLDRLALPVRVAVQTASVLGREFDTSVLAHMLDHPSTLEEHLAIGDRAAIWAAIAETRYLFRHALLRDAAYDMQLRGQLRHLHRRAAQAIEQIYAAELAPQYATLVHHCRQGEEPDHERHYAGLAGEYAAEQYANLDAVRYLTRALELTETQDAPARLRHIMARERVYHVLGDRTAQRADLEAMTELSFEIGDAHNSIEILLRQASLALFTAQNELALTWASKAVTATGTLADPIVTARCLNELGRILWQQGKYVDARRELEQALHLTEGMGNSAERANSAYYLGLVAYHQADYPTALAHFQQAQPQFHDLGERLREVNCLTMYGAICNQRGEYADAYRHLTEGLDIARAIGWRYGETYALIELGYLSFDAGDYVGAQKYHQQALLMYREVLDRQGEAISLDTLGLVAHRLGRKAEAEALFRDASAIQKEIEDRRGEAYTLTHLGLLLIDEEAWQASADALHRAIQLRRELGDETSMIDSLAGLAFVDWKIGNLAVAIRGVDDILDRLEAHGTDGVEFPVQVYLTCHQVLQAAAHENFDCAFRAEHVLREGNRLLQARAAMIEDENLRRIFVENIPAHRTIAALLAQEGA